MMSYKNEVRKFIEDNLEIDDVVLADTDNYFKLRFVNSLFAMRLVNFVESKFSIEITNDELNLDNFSSIQKVTALIDKKMLQAV